MIPPDDISVHLPAPRDDEPRALRSDIADELADHLACSVARERLRDEQHRGRSEEELLGEALDRFGDPREVARRLWWDAMKEKIMTQRVILGVTLVAAAAAIGAVALLAQLMANNREDQKQMLGAQREWMQAMLAEVRKPRESQGGDGRFSDWQPLRVKLVDEEGNPVEGGASCTGRPFGKDDAIEQQVQTDATGLADFGRLPAGPYTVTCYVKATSESGGRTDILLGPGRPSETTIRCPTKYDTSVPATFTITAPGDISPDRLYFVAQLRRLGRNVDGIFWQYVGEPKAVAVLLDAKGTVLGEFPIDFINGTGRRGGLLRAGSMPRVFGEFISEIPSMIPLSRAQNIIPSLYDVAFAAYGAEVLPDNANNRPTLHVLTAAPRVERNIDRESVVVDESTSHGNAFWADVRQSFTRLEMIKQSRRDAAVSEGDSSHGIRLGATGHEDASPTSSTTAPVHDAEEPGPTGIRGAALRADDLVDNVAESNALATAPPAPAVPPASALPPRTTTLTVPVRINIETPDHLKNEPLWYLVHFAPHEDLAPEQVPAHQSQLLLVDAKGEVQGELPQRGPGWENFLPVQSASGATIRFPAKLPQRVPVLPHKGFSLGDYDAIAVPYLAARKETVAGARPTLDALNGFDVFLARLQIGAKEGGTLTIGADQTEFWDGIDEVMREWVQEEAAESQKKSGVNQASPAENPGQN